ncbi:hypothetical protein B0H13DRAFT_1866450 [Mycena leptocephala]|nr:hypothetical protein B0H13DRAFT_1866450 [Mycena leptocephala]
MNLGNGMDWASRASTCTCTRAPTLICTHTHREDRRGNGHGSGNRQDTVANARAPQKERARTEKGGAATERVRVHKMLATAAARAEYSLEPGTCQRQRPQIKGYLNPRYTHVHKLSAPTKKGREDKEAREVGRFGFGFGFGVVVLVIGDRIRVDITHGRARCVFEPQQGVVRIDSKETHQAEGRRKKEETQHARPGEYACPTERKKERKAWRRGNDDGNKRDTMRVRSEEPECAYQRKEEREKGSEPESESELEPGTEVIGCQRQRQRPQRREEARYAGTLELRAGFGLGAPGRFCWWQWGGGDFGHRIGCGKGKEKVLAAAMRMRGRKEEGGRRKEARGGGGKDFEINLRLHDVTIDSARDNKRVSVGTVGSSIPVIRNQQKSATVNVHKEGKRIRFREREGVGARRQTQTGERWGEKEALALCVVQVDYTRSRTRVLEPGSRTRLCRCAYAFAFVDKTLKSERGARTTLKRHSMRIVKAIASAQRSPCGLASEIVGPLMHCTWVAYQSLRSSRFSVSKRRRARTEGGIGTARDGVRVGLCVHLPASACC